jgi:hypothetical protein
MVSLCTKAPQGAFQLRWGFISGKWQLGLALKTLLHVATLPLSSGRRKQERAGYLDGRQAASVKNS